MNRIFKKTVNLDKQKVLKFFESRATQNDTSPLGATMYVNEQQATARDAYEKRLVQPKIQPYIDKVIDIGCGAGRWASLITQPSQVYLGVDFSDKLVKLAKEAWKNNPNIHFQVMRAEAVRAKSLITPGPFTLCLITGLLIYMNDAEVDQLFKNIDALLAKNALIYLREPCSHLEERMTLKDYPSADLHASYHAIYRTPQELMRYFEQYLPGFKLKEHADLYPPHLHKRKETKHMYFIFERDT